MIIHVYAIAWNEEIILPYFLRYYSDFCEKMVIYDNESTDNTAAIVNSFSTAELRKWSSNGQFNDQLHLDIKQNCYKESRGIADWVIVVDCDEFIFHPDLIVKLEMYKNSGITLPKMTGYDMVPNCELDPNANLPYMYRRGARATNFDKRAIFNPSIDIRYDAGCHRILNSPHEFVESEDSLFMFHYKKLNVNYYKSRHQSLGVRLSELNRARHWGFHYLWSPEQMEAEYNQVLSNCIDIL